MASTKKLSVRLAVEGGRVVKAELKGVGDAGEDSFRRIERSAASIGPVITRLAGTAAGAFSIRQLVTYADGWTDLNARVRLATSSEAQGAAVMERLADMARRSYSDITQTTEGWLSNARALRDMGLSTRETLDFTEALNNAMVVSGAKAERATRVQDALSKAMALGTLSGVNLNTVIQQGGRVAELLAEELGTTVSGLRQLGAQGAITGEVIERALIGNLQTLRDEADSMPATIGDAFMQINNAAMRLVGTWDTIISGSGLVAEALLRVADNLEHLAAIGIAFAGFMAVRWVAGMVAAATATGGLTAALVLLKGAIIRTGLGALIVAAGELIYWFGRLVTGAGGFGAALELLGNVASAVWDGIKVTVGSLADDFRAAKAEISRVWSELMAYLAGKWADFLAFFGPSINASAELVGSDYRVDAFGAAARASMLEHAASNAGIMAEFYRERARTAREHAFDGVGAAAQALLDAVSGADDASDSLDDAAGSVDRVTDALNDAGRAGGAAGQAIAAGAEEALTGWDAVRNALSDYALKATDISKDIGSTLVGAFQSAENAVGEFVRTGKLKISELVTSLLADLAKLGARRFIFGPLAGALANVLPGLGAMGGMIAGVGHTGGMAEALPGRRMVPALAFAGAPRMHGGGMVGLRPDEVPAILQRGERVLSRREIAAGAAGGVTVNIYARDAESFRQSRAQVAADIARAVAFGRRGM